MTVFEKIVKLFNVTVDSVSGRETFQNALSRQELVLADLIVTILVLVGIFAFGKYLWNSVACPHVTFLKPLSSVWQLVGLIILVQLFK